jgi:hypothetical protein
MLLLALEHMQRTGGTTAAIYGVLNCQLFRQDFPVQRCTLESISVDIEAGPRRLNSINLKCGFVDDVQLKS